MWDVFDLFDTHFGWNFLRWGLLSTSLKVCDDTHPKHWRFNDNRLAGQAFLHRHSLAIARFSRPPGTFACTKFPH
jgi:hypothetical protein